MYQKLAKTWAGLLFGFIALLLPLYIPKNGYYDIGEEKFKFFLCGMSILTLVGMLLFLLSFFQKKKTRFHLNSIDVFAILFACFCSVSFLFFGHKDIALIGNEEWYMGLISQLLFVIIYFGISRYLLQDHLLLAGKIHDLEASPAVDTPICEIHPRNGCHRASAHRADLVSVHVDDMGSACCHYLI